MGKQLILAVAALALSACASTAPEPVSNAITAPAAPRVLLEDAAEYRQALEEAWDHIIARSSDRNPPLVDADAALSMTIPDHPSIRGAARYFSTELHDSIQTSLYRSREYKEMIDGVLTEQDLPRGLAYLPVIESAYLPALTSRAGAHGMWQFMPETARLYGLKINWWIDERANPEKSTRAAARYLRDLHAEFGDWSLALAAYNCGPGRVRKALARKDAGTFWELLDAKALPRETRGYVPTFFATLMIVSDPEAYGFHLTDILTPEVATVELEGPVSLEFIASSGGVKQDDLRRLNPELRRAIVPPGIHAVRLPPEAAETVRARGASLRFDDPVVEAATFVVRPGDSLQTLANQLSLEARDLVDMNGLTSRQLRAGTTIYVPLRPQELSARLQAERFHLVRKGDTLYSIAKANALTVGELRDLNQLSRKEVIHAGQRLRVSTRAAVLAGN